MSKIKITNCESCYQCCEALPSVFSDNGNGGIKINQEAQEKYPIPVIESCCPFNNIEVSND